MNAPKISFVCWHCNRKLNAPLAAAGRTLTCPGCSERITVPDPAEPPPPPPPRRPESEPPPFVPFVFGGEEPELLPLIDDESGTDTATPLPYETPNPPTPQHSPQIFVTPSPVIIQATPSNSLGTAGFVVSLVGFVACGILTPLGLVLSLFGLSKQPQGLAIAGTVIGLIGSLLILPVFIFFFLVPFFFSAGGIMDRIGPASRRTADISAAQAQLSSLSMAIDIFVLDMNRLPQMDEGLQALILRPTGSNWQGPYLDDATIPLDPWGGQYHYTLIGDDAFEIRSAGPDEVMDTVDDIVELNTSAM